MRMEDKCRVQSADVQNADRISNFCILALVPL